MHLGDCLGGYVFLDETREKTIAQPKYVTQGDVTEDVFATDARILEINSKSGLYPLYVAYSIFRNRIKEKYPDKDPNTLTVAQQQELWDKTVAENVFVLCKTPMAKSITKRTLVGFRAANVNTHYFEDMVRQITQRPEKFIAKIIKGQSYWKANNNNDMKFNAIVGNPPYQDSSENTSDTPIYNHFMDISFRISDKVTFITPGRFLFNAGKTPKDWNKKILSDKHFKVIWYESDSTKIFPNVDIKGGVAVTFRDAKNDFGVIGDYSPHDQVSNILEKVRKNNFKSLSEIVFAPESYRLSKKLHAKNKDVKDRLSIGHAYDLTTNIFEKLNDFFFENKPNDNGNYIQILGRINNERVYYWIRREYVDKHDNLEKFKVILPKSNGTGSLGEKLSTPLTAEPNIGHNQTFISIGSFETAIEAENLLKYIKSKFLRLLLGTLKVTQDNKKAVWQNIPTQDFTANSDIDWSKSIPEIDEQLYKKYQLSAEEVAFIKSMIKPMAE